MSFIVDRDGKAKSPVGKTKKSAARGFAAIGSGVGLLKMLESTDTLTSIWKRMDTDKSETVSRGELCNWIITSRVFGGLNPGDAELTSKRIFDDIDQDRTNYLDFNEFCKFIELIRREQKLLRYASKHRLTQLPASVRLTNNKQFSVSQLESVLHEKIQQLTSRDSDRYRQILTLFKHQVERSQGNNADSSTLHMSARDFNTFLAMLGLFATREQADLLFNKYDANGDGVLSVHEFLTRAKAPDYPGLNVGEPFNAAAARRGKKQFHNTARYGIPVKAATPSTNIYDMGTERMYDCIRERLEATARTGSVLSDFKARRSLFRAFEIKDPEHTGKVTIENFKEALKTFVGVTLGGQHNRALCSKYADANGMIDYPALVMEVYPNKTVSPSTSLCRDHPGQPSPSSSTRNGRDLSRGNPENMVHLTGSYWLTRGGSKSPLPPLSRGASTGLLSVRGRTPGVSTPGSRVRTPQL